MKRLSPLLVLLSPLLALPADANIEIEFVESAPKDRFVFTNSGNCQLRDLVVDVDLTDSQGQLIFDTTAEGDGVEVFQPFEQREGVVELTSSNKVNDGDKRLSVRIGSLPANQRVSFTIDVDDTLSNSTLGQIRVTGAEIQNGTVAVRLKDTDAKIASFDETSRALILMEVCA